MDNKAALLSPPGELSVVLRKTVHWRRWGTPSAKPPVILECGLTMMSSCWAWIAAELSRHTEVFAYDRSGLGWSEEREGIRSGKELCEEFIAWIQAIQLPPPFILIGHSMGAFLLRALAMERPSWCKGMIFLDPAHPKQMEWSRSIRRRMRNFFLLLEGANLLAGKGLPVFTLPLAAPVRHLPDPDRDHLLAWFQHPRHLRTSAREARGWKQTAALVRGTTLGSIPLLTISAQKHALPGWNEMQQDLLKLSSASEHATFTDSSHLTLLTHRQHAARAAETIEAFLASIS